MTDDDDRLDRAERIRRMREGRTADDGDGDTTDGEESDRPTADDEEAPTDNDTPETAAPSSDEQTKTQDDADDSMTEQTAEANEESDDTTATAEPDEGSQPVEQQTPDADAVPATPQTGAEGASAEEDPTAATDALPEQAVAGEVTEEMTAAEVARALDQQTTADADADARGGLGARSEEAAAVLQAGSISGETIVDDEFFEAGGRAQIIEFTIGDEVFAIDVGYVGEILETPEITRMPNTPDCVEGVVDLRGKVTAVMDPSLVLASDAALVDRSLIVVLDDEAIEFDGTVGWLVDDVRQVATVSSEQITDPIDPEDWTRGIVDRDDEPFVIWADPIEVLDSVDGTAAEAGVAGGEE